MKEGRETLSLTFFYYFVMPVAVGEKFFHETRTSAVKLKPTGDIEELNTAAHREKKIESATLPRVEQMVGI